LLKAGGQDPADLPSYLAGGWMGQDVPVSAAERAVLPPDTGYSRKNYVWLHNASRQVFVSIVLSGRDRTSIHRPELCLLGQGWTIDGRFGHDFAYPGSGQTAVPATVLRVRREVLVPRGGRMAVPSLVAYWFVGRDRVVAGHWARMWWSAVDRLCRLRSSRWAYVVVQTNALDGEAAGPSADGARSDSAGVSTAARAGPRAGGAAVSPLILLLTNDVGDGVSQASGRRRMRDAQRGGQTARPGGIPPRRIPRLIFWPRDLGWRP
jgi:hypothetical protein